MANLSRLAPITTAATALSNLVLVSPQNVVGYQPQQAGTLTSQPALAPSPALLFHYEGENSVSLESDITDHYIEDNSAIQDQVALKPAIITVHGFIGELNNVPPVGLSFLKAIANQLTTVSAYTPQLTTTALIAYNEAFLIYQTAANAVNSAVSAWSSLTGSGGENVIGSTGLQSPISFTQTRQQTAFQQFYGYWNARTLFTVQTPWAIFQNMIIQKLRAVQDAESRMYTDFEVTFKTIRIASTSLTSALAAQVQGRLNNQKADLVDAGNIPTTPMPAGSFSSNIAGIPS